MSDNDKLKQKEELWKKIRKDISKYIQLLVEISDDYGYRLRPRLVDDGTLYDWADTTNFKNVEEFKEWEMATGFAGEMCNLIRNVEDNRQVYVSMDNLLSHFNINLKENLEVRRKLYSLSTEIKKAEDEIKNLIETDVDITFLDVRGNGSEILLKLEDRPLWVDEKKELYDNYLTIVDEYRDEENNHCYVLET